LRCGVFAKLLAVRTDPGQGERFFTAGLLHDVGRLIILKNLPTPPPKACSTPARTSCPTSRAERAVLGFDHGQVAGILLDRWRFPASLSSIIAAHHDPLFADDQRGAAILQLADLLALASEITAGGMYVLPNPVPQAFELAGLTPDDLPDLLEASDAQIETVAAIFLAH
jgi:HD-like signal output (HDOD) protein